MARGTRGWGFGRGLGVEALEGRQLLAAPVIEPIPAVDVPGGKTLIVPLRGGDADGDPITYTATSDASGVRAEVRSGGPFLRLSVEGFGDLEFQLFGDLVPNTVRQITDLVDDGFYDGLTFHRVIPGFVIQGGDPEGDGTGGPGFSFDDEFVPSAIFSGNGQLAMANSGKDTNGSQFFVTLGPQRSLDFNHTIFGQLVRGQDVAEAIADVPTGSNDRPSTPVVISDAQIVANTTDAVLLIHADEGVDAATVTVTASDGNGETDTETIAVDVVADATDDPPILGRIGNQQAVSGVPLGFDLSSTDLEGDPVEYQANLLTNADRASVSVSGNRVTVTPQAGFTGDLTLRVGVRQQGATSRGTTANPFDTQEITVSVAASSLPIEGVTVSGTEGVALENIPVARIPATAGGEASDYSATIDWGDGTTTAGTVVDREGGGFEVRGTHTYAADGDYPMVISVTGPDDTTASTLTTVTVVGAQAAPLAVSVVGSPRSVSLGGDVAYSVVIRNTGTTQAQGVTLLQTLPAGSTFVSSTIAPTSQAAGQVTIPVGTLAAGESRTVTIVARPTAVGTYTTLARVSAQGIAAVSASDSTTVTEAPAPNPTPTTPPRVVNLERFGVGHDPIRIVLTFDGPIDPATAEDPNAYRLVLPGKDDRMGTEDDLVVPIVAATYDEDTQTVTLEPRYRLPYQAFARLEVRSGGESGLVGEGGSALDGDGDGVAGGAFIARSGRGIYLDRAEVLRESASPGSQPSPGPLRLVVRTGGQAYRVGQIAPLFSRAEAIDRFLIASGMASVDSGQGGGTGSAARSSGSGTPLGPHWASWASRNRG